MIVWNWRKNEIISSTVIMPNVMINSLDWHPSYILIIRIIHREELLLIACGTTVYIWNYLRNEIYNLFPASARKYSFAFFYGDGENFIACTCSSAHSLLSSREYNAAGVSSYPYNLSLSSCQRCIVSITSSHPEIHALHHRLWM